MVNIMCPLQKNTFTRAVTISVAALPKERRRGRAWRWPDTRLRMRQVIALVVVQREAQAALILPQVVAHEVGVLGQVDRLQGKPPQALPPINRLIVPAGTAHHRSSRTSSDVGATQRRCRAD
jgi:hypothetical protein